MTDDNPIYYVDSEQCRGERRLYWVADRTRRGASIGHGKAVSRLYTSQKSAERECDRLNAATGSGAST